MEGEEIIQGTANKNNDDDNGEYTNTPVLVVKWIHKPSKIASPEKEWVVWCTSQLLRLEQFQVHVVPTVNNNTSNAADVDIDTDVDVDADNDAEKKEVLQHMVIPTTNELEMIEIFRQANIVAITQALQALAMMTPSIYQKDEDSEDDDNKNDDDEDDEDDQDDKYDEDEDEDEDDDENDEDEEGDKDEDENKFDEGEL